MGLLDEEMAPPDQRVSSGSITQDGKLRCAIQDEAFSVGFRFF
jgi:hypothetical protein